MALMDSSTQHQKDNAAYAAILKDLYSGDAEDAYLRLMRREDKVLETISHVATAERQKQVSDLSFGTASIPQLVDRASRSLGSMLTDIAKADDAGGVLRAFDAPDRRVFVGVLLIAAAMFLLFIQAGQ